MSKSPVDLLKDWFEEGKRDFPWRRQPTPYGVWVSEVMLQQTRASVVCSYYERWMHHFPTLSDLASADLDEVLKLWEGLGYYSRARNLHKGAKEIVEGSGQLPSTYEALIKISGIGPYTAGAILSFAFQQKAPAIDGNVERVIARYGAIEGEVKKHPAKRHIEEVTVSLLEGENPWIAMEGLIELGATVCLPKKPKCELCPLKSVCRAYNEGRIDDLPYKKKREKTVFLEKHVVIAFHGSLVLVEKKVEGKVLGGLTEFPSLPYDANKDVDRLPNELFGFEGVYVDELPSTKQSYTKFHVDLYPTVFEMEKAHFIEGYSWQRLEDVENQMTLSSGHKRVLKSLVEYFQEPRLF